MIGSIIGLILIIGLGVYGYIEYTQNHGGFSFLGISLSLPAFLVLIIAFAAVHVSGIVRAAQERKGRAQGEKETQEQDSKWPNQKIEVK